MSSATHYSLLKMRAKTGILKPFCIALMTGDYRLMSDFMAARVANCMAVALTELPAAFVPFQR